MYYSAAAFSGSIQLNGKSPKTFDTIVSTNLCFKKKIDFGGLQSSSPQPLHTLGAPLSKITI